MRERRKNLHSIISKISGNVDSNSEPDTQEPAITSVPECSTTQSDDKAVSEMKIADDQPQRPQTRMFSKDGGDQLRQEAAIRRINSQLLDPVASPPFICDLCSVAFLTKRELQLHVMCHGIHIAGNVAEEKVKAAVQRPGEAPTSPTLSTGPTTETTILPPEGSKTSEGQNDESDPEPVVVNSEVKIVDVLSLATATRGFKEPGSIWCSLCKCTVDKGHTCKVYQTSYHAEKTNEEGFTCELCGRFYNQKRKLRTHLRNRHKGFRLQEDEGYMCWQCWQAFPEIKILEEHIVQVHGHESRRQNSTWRPFTQPSTLPLEENADENVCPDPTASPVENTSNADQLNLALKRAGENTHSNPPAKKPHMEVANGVISVAEVNGKVVVTDAPLPTENSASGQTCIFIPNKPQEKSNEKLMKGDIPGTVNSVHFGSPNGMNGSDTRNQTMSNSITNTTVPFVENPKKRTASSLKQQCPHCPERFPKKYMLQLHIQEAHGENMHCFYCSTSCATKEVLASHIKTVHTEEMKNAKCPICQCKCLGELHQHIVQYHHKDLLTRKSKERVLSTCPICHAATTDAYHLRWHILREHRGLQLPKELQDGLGEDTESESGSSVSNEGPDAVADGTKGYKAPFDSNGEHKGTKEGNDNREKLKDELEIVFVSDRNIKSDWSAPRANSVPTTSTAIFDRLSPRTNSVPPASAVASDRTSPKVNGVSPTSAANNRQCIKKDADSSNGVSPKVDQSKSVQDNVHSTTELDEKTRASPVMYDHHSLSQDTCVFCFKKLTKETLTPHLRSDHGWVDKFTCPICSFRDDKYVTIVEHFCQSHFHPTEETPMTQCDAKCLKCDIIFQDIPHLKRHSSALHSFQLSSEASYDTFKCRHCNIIFEKQFDAQKHFDVYHLFRIRYKCESCRMGFTAKHDFQEHITCNHPELVKSFCPVCGLGFEVSSDLEEHVFEMHRRKAHFFCGQCGNEFSDRFHVHMHIRSNCCVTWADSNFECLDCLTAFSTISELRIHCKQKSCKQDVKE